MLAFPPDITFFIQLASFFVLLSVLNKLLFAPYMQLLEERDQRTEGASRDAVEDRAEADELARRIEVEMSAARTLAAQEADVIRQRTRQEEAEILERAKWDSTAKLTELRAGIEHEREQALGKLKDDARALADEMVIAVLGTK